MAVFTKCTGLTNRSVFPRALGMQEEARALWCPRLSLEEGCPRSLLGRGAGAGAGHESHGAVSMTGLAALQYGVSKPVPAQTVVVLSQRGAG